MRQEGFSTRAWDAFRASAIPDEGPDGSSHRGVYRWDPRLKLFLLVFAVALNVGLARIELSIFLFFLAVTMAVWSRIPPRHFLFFLIAPAWATLVVFLGFSVGFGVTPVLSLGPFTLYEEGLLQGASAAARVACDMAWMALVFLTTPFMRVLEALRWFRIPAAVTETLATAYRYAFLLADEFRRMRMNAGSRGGLQGFPMKAKTSGMIVAQIVMRAYDRAHRIHSAMVSRGAQAVPVPGSRSAHPEIGECPNACDVSPMLREECDRVIRCEHLTYAYPGKGPMAIQDVSFEVRRGEVVAVCGHNGSGKTSLLKLLAGILAPVAGDVYLSGKRVDRKWRNEAFRHVGILFEDPNDQLFCTHVREDVAYGPRNLGLDSAEVDRLVHTSMELMQISHLADRPIHRLSHGEMKRVGLAGLIAMRPPVVLLDEPTAGLDPASSRELTDLIRHLNEHHGYTFVIVTHAVDLAPMIATRVILLKNGRIAADGPLRAVLTDAALLEESGLEPPLLTRLFELLGGHAAELNGTPLTVYEAAAVLSRRLRFAEQGFHELCDGKASRSLQAGHRRTMGR